MSCVSSSLAESQLFGSMPGGFTDARANPGVFERADGGSLFLDEIGELDYGLQPKLLRVLEDGEVTRLGSSVTRKVKGSAYLRHEPGILLTMPKSGGSARIFCIASMCFGCTFRRFVTARKTFPFSRPRFCQNTGKSFLSELSTRCSVMIGPAISVRFFGCLARATGESPSDIIQPDHILF